MMMKMRASTLASETDDLSYSDTIAHVPPKSSGLLKEPYYSPPRAIELLKKRHNRSQRATELAIRGAQYEEFLLQAWQSRREKTRDEFTPSQELVQLLLQSYKDDIEIAEAENFSNKEIMEELKSYREQLFNQKKADETTSFIKKVVIGVIAMHARKSRVEKKIGKVRLTWESKFIPLIRKDLIIALRVGLYSPCIKEIPEKLQNDIQKFLESGGTIKGTWGELKYDLAGIYIN